MVFCCCRFVAKDHRVSVSNIIKSGLSHYLMCSQKRPTPTNQRSSKSFFSFGSGHHKTHFAPLFDRHCMRRQKELLECTIAMSTVKRRSRQEVLDQLVLFNNVCQHPFDWKSINRHAENERQTICAGLLDRTCFSAKHSRNIRLMFIFPGESSSGGSAFPHHCLPTFWTACQDSF